MYLARNETSKTDSEQYIAEIIISDTYDMKIYKYIWWFIIYENTRLK
jgi:hypothetical protein